MTTLQPVLLGQVIDNQRPVLPYWRRVIDGFCSESHAHPRGQLIFSAKGITRVITKQGIYLVPSQQAFWCPPNHEHMLVFPGAVDIANLFIDPEWAKYLPSEQQVLDVSPLLKELILEAVKIGEEYSFGSREYRLMVVIVDEIQSLPVSSLLLPWAESKKLQVIMSEMTENPTSRNTVEQWADCVHVSTRTLLRMFKQEVNMTFSEWRMQVRLFYALEQLYKGFSVTSVALDLGYSSPSAFIAAFKKTLGNSPLEYITKQ